MLERVVRKLESVSVLSEAEKLAVRGWFSGTRRVAGGEEIVREGEAPQAVSVLVEGLACRHRSLPDGRRQIMAYLLPGDLLDLHALIMGEMDHSICALTPCKIALAPHQRMTETMEQFPELERALWRDTLIDAALAREWLVGLGRRSAYGRIAHLLSEVTERLDTAGLGEGGVIELPLTQQELADSLGLSLVHVNRVLQRLRASGLISLGRGALQIVDRDGLKAAGGFDASYLRARSSGLAA